MRSKTIRVTVESLPAALAQLRRAAGKSQRQAAEASGISHVTIARYETGRPPDLANLLTLLRAYGAELSIHTRQGR